MSLIWALPCVVSLAETEELRRTLQSLACGRVRVLQKHPAGKDVNETDSFSFNLKFESDKLKLKVNQIQQAQSVRLICPPLTEQILP